MPLSPLVSVIIPAHNAEPYIRATLDSVFAQTYPKVEVIVADDGSTDRTRECIAEYGDRVTYLYGTNRKGASRPRNMALQAAAGDLIVPLDSDDVLLPDRIAREVDFMLAHPSVGLVYSDYREFDNPDWEDTHFSRSGLLSARLRQLPAGATGLVLEPHDASDILLTENFGHSSPMVRRHVARAVGGYDESATLSEDFWFGFCIASAYPIAVMPQVGWHKRNHPLNQSSNVPRILNWKIETRQRILAAERCPRRRRKVKRMIGRYHSDLAYYYTGRNNRLAWRHAVSSLKLRPHRSPKVLLRLLFDLLGRDTNRSLTRAS
jgi:glycosyltransferase involved in cell wall biosynthesis